MWCRGVRGATTATANSKEAILEATRELLKLLIAANDIEPENVAYALFTTTRDLNAEFPAVAARQLGWTDVALMCGHEMEVPGATKGVVRIMILLNTEKAAKDIEHIYMKGAANLKTPVDLVG
ncbi:MAG: chorismate mutase [Chloroflexi bacterium]|nr:chorismate mutase [Chloroflexota bacterium]